MEGNLQILGSLEAPPLGRRWRLSLAQDHSYQNPHNQSHSECMHAKRGEGAQRRKNYLFPQPQNSCRNCLPLSGAAVTSVEAQEEAKGVWGLGALSPFLCMLHNHTDGGRQMAEGSLWMP